MDARLPVRGLFTDRTGGVSAAPWDRLNLATHVGDDVNAVDFNRGLVEDRIGGPIVFMRPDHGVRVAFLGREFLDGGEPPVADVLVTAVPGLAVAALAADCVPVLAHDRATGAVAAFHCGREGLRKGVIDAGVAALIDLRGGWERLEAISFAIGPAICGLCYEVPAGMQAEVAQHHPASKSTTRWGNPGLDLPAAVAARLGKLGFTSVVRHDYCTREDTSYFSHRRDGVTGRQAGVVMCEGV